jgi:hypothetical protein
VSPVIRPSLNAILGVLLWMDIKRGIMDIHISQSALSGGNEAVNKSPDAIASKILIPDFLFMFL